MTVFKYYLIVISLLFFTKIHSQNNFIQQTNAAEGDFIYYKLETAEKKIDGSQFFNNEWEKSSISMLNGSIFKEEFVKYDIFYQRIIFLRDNVEYYIPKILRIEKFEIGSSSFIYLYDTLKNETAFFQVLSSGNDILFLKKHECSIAEGKKSNGILPEINDKYRINVIYYIKKTKEQAIKIKLNKNIINNIFSNKIIEIQSYIKENKLNIRKEEDAIRIFNFYNSINS